MAEAKNAVAEKAQLVESKEREIRIQKDQAERKAVMSEMLAPLSADKRAIMQELLESVQTPKLATAFDKYLPAVMEGSSKKVVKTAEPVKTVITEGTEVTGNREAQPAVGLDNILDIRKLAGLK